MEKLLPNLTVKNTYMVHIKKLNQTLNNGLKLKKYIELLDLNRPIR